MWEDVPTSDPNLIRCWSRRNHVGSATSLTRTKRSFRWISNMGPLIWPGAILSSSKPMDKDHPVKLPANPSTLFSVNSYPPSKKDNECWAEMSKHYHHTSVSSFLLFSAFISPLVTLKLIIGWAFLEPKPWECLSCKRTGRLSALDNRHHVSPFFVTSWSRARRDKNPMPDPSGVP